MSFRLFNPGCCCDCTADCFSTKTIGYAAEKIGNIDSEYIENISNNVAAVWNCDLVFVSRGACGWTLPGTWVAGAATVASWVRAGGRLFVMGEYPSCFLPEEITRINQFLQAVGSTLRQKEDDFRIYDCGCDCKNNGKHNIEATITSYNKFLPIYHACTGIVTGGTEISLTNEGIPSECWFAGEKFGNGYIFLCADSNILANCKYNNCELWYNILNKDNLLQ